MSGTREGPATVEGITPRVSRFYWCWLIFATTVSVLGNITHAVLVAPGAVKLLAAVASVVPPAFLVGSTHAAALSLRARRFALTYVLGLSMTIGVAACAFLLSFDALRGLAVILGWPSGRAWLFPIAIDVAIAHATLCLLSLSRRATEAVVNDVAVDAVSTRAVPRRAGSASAAVSPVDTPGVERWQPLAESLVREGVTSKDPHLVAAILAQREAGVLPSVIGRHHRVHHTTVRRILSAAQTLTA